MSKWMDALRDWSISFIKATESGWSDEGKFWRGSGEGAAIVSMGEFEASWCGSSIRGLDLAGLLDVGEDGSECVGEEEGMSLA